MLVVVFAHCTLASLAVGVIDLYHIAISHPLHFWAQKKQPFLSILAVTLHNPLFVVLHIVLLWSSLSDLLGKGVLFNAAAENFKCLLVGAEFNGILIRLKENLRLVLFD